MRKKTYKVSRNMIGILILIVFSCGNPKEKQNKGQQIKVKKTADSAKSNLDWLIKGDTIQLASNYGIISLPKDSISYYRQTLKGIYQINDDSIVRVFSLLHKDIMFFTTYNDAGTGYRSLLYAYDFRKKIFLKQSLAKRNYLFSSAGIFFINNNYIINMYKPYWLEKKQSYFTSADVYKVSNNEIKYLKTIYSLGEMTYDENSIIKFYDRNVKRGIQNATILPKNWER